MSVAWVAGAIRGRALARRCLGDAAEEVATQPSLSAALRVLSDSTYGHGMKGDMDLESAQRAVAGTALWHLRVLAGWLPPEGVALVRALAGWFEMGELEELAVVLETMGPRPAGLHLGALAAVGGAADAASLAELRQLLAHSEWGDPGGVTLADILLGMRLGWARALRRTVSEREAWGAGALALAAAVALFLRADRGEAPAAGRIPEFRAGWAEAQDVAGFVATVPSPGRWVFRDVREPEELWRAERAWWLRLERDAAALLKGHSLGRETVLGAAALLVADSRRVQGALARAARGGAREVAHARA